MVSWDFQGLQNAKSLQPVRIYTCINHHPYEQWPKPEFLIAIPGIPLPSCVMSISKAIESQDPFEPESDLPDGNIQSQEQWKKRPNFPLNPGCLIGILMIYNVLIR